MTHEEFTEALRVALRERPPPMAHETPAARTRAPRLEGAMRAGVRTSEFWAPVVNRAIEVVMVLICLYFAETLGKEALLGLIVPGIQAWMGERTSQAYTAARTEVKRAQLELAAVVERRAQDGA